MVESALPVKRVRLAPHGRHGTDSTECQIPTTSEGIDVPSTGSSNTYMHSVVVDSSKGTPEERAEDPL